MFVRDYQENLQVGTMTICLFYFSFVFGINCEEITAPSYSTRVYSTTQSSSAMESSSATHSYSYHSSECKVTFYSDQNNEGEKIDISQPAGISYLQMREQSAQTFGRCCWKIYK